MFHSLQCTMVKPFVVGSSVLITLIEIMETICEKVFKRAYKSLMVAKILKNERAEEFHF